VAINHYNEKRFFLKKYARLKKKIFKTKESSRGYESIRQEFLEQKRQFYNKKIDDIVENWNNYDYCPGRRWYRAITGLAKTIDELNKRE